MQFRTYLRDARTERSVEGGTELISMLIELLHLTETFILSLSRRHLLFGWPPIPQHV